MTKEIDIFKNAIMKKETFGCGKDISDKKVMHVAFGVDANFVRPMGVTMTSLLENNLDEYFVINIFVSSIFPKDKIRLKQFSDKYNVKINLYYVNTTVFNNLKITDRISIAMYYRLLIPKILKNETDKVLYLDADIACIGSIKKLIDLFFEDKTVMVVHDTIVDSNYTAMLGVSNNSYFNSGMLYMNILLWNKENISEKTLEYLMLNSQKLRLPDQDALNIVLQNQTKILDKQWNFLCDITLKGKRAILSIPDNTVFIHYVCFNKPWHRWCIHPLALPFQNYMKNSLWKDEPLWDKPRGYQEMKLYGIVLWKEKKYIKSLYWFLKYTLIKLKEKPKKILRNKFGGFL